MSAWLPNILIDGVVREVKTRVSEQVSWMVYGCERKWKVNQWLFEDNITVTVDNREELKIPLAYFGWVCDKRDLKVNSTVMRCNREGGRPRCWYTQFWLRKTGTGDYFFHNCVWILVEEMNHRTGEGTHGGFQGMNVSRACYISC